MTRTSAPASLALNAAEIAALPAPTTMTSGLLRKVTPWLSLGDC